MNDQPIQGGYYPPPTPPRRSRNYTLPISCAVGCLPWLILGFLFLIFIAGMGGGGGEEKSEHVALIRVGGVITAGRSGSSFMGGSVTGSEDVVDQLESARENDKAKAVVIRVNSPGGSPAGSEEIYNAIRRLRKEGKPVYVSMGDVAASGGYYVAAACDRIYADQSSITGSIGVIYQSADMSQLFKKIGLSPEVVKSGKFKDIGSPNRPLTPEERKLIQGIVDTTYGSFVEAVARGRGMSFEEVKALADGRVFTGTQALKLKLVDKIGGLHETVIAAAAAAGIKGTPNLVEYRKEGWLESILGAEESTEVGRRVEDAMLRRLMDSVLSEDSRPTGPR